jgi:hypothetical protein
MASHSPPGPDSSLAPSLIGAIVALHVLSLSAFGTRIYTRIKPVLRLRYDDYFIAAAVVSTVLVTNPLGSALISSVF